MEAIAARMTLAEFKSSLSEHPDLALRFQLPDGGFIPAHAHVTEIAMVEKRFVDCGGTIRAESVCRLQLWVAKDFWHRFTAGKLLAILSKAAGVLGPDSLPVDVEYDLDVLTQSPVEDIAVVKDELVVKLKARHAACLAKEGKRGRGRGLLHSLNPFRFFR